MLASSTLAPLMAVSSRSTPDRALAAAVARGERGACEQMARRLLPSVRRVARALVIRAADSDDASQVALLEVLRAAGNYRGEGSLEAWGRRIAARAVMRWQGKQRLRDAKTMTFEAELDPRESQLSTAVVDALPRPLSHYLRALPPVQRDAFVLRHCLGHTLPEIASMTDAAVPTVKSRILKAQQELRRLVRRDVTLGIHQKATFV